MLDRLETFVEADGIVGRFDRHGSLGDDRSVVHQLIDEMHRNPGFRHSGFERLLDCVRTGEGWQERRMHVDDRVREAFDGRRSQDPHEPGEDEGLRTRRVGGVAHRGCERFAIFEVGPRDDCGVDLRPLGAIKSGDAITVRNDEDDGTAEVGIRRSIDECLKIGTAPRYQDGYGQLLWHRSGV